MKSDRNPVTELDCAIEDAVRDYLHGLAPSVGFLGEERGRVESANSALTWALDPIDGTVNLLHGIPLCGISLGLTREGESILGVIDLPFLDLRYSASLHGGAYRNDKPIKVSDATQISDCVISIGDYAVGPDAAAKNADRFELTKSLAHSAQRVRMLGSAATDLAWVADGKLGATIMLANKPWDTTAGVLIAREAGAAVFDMDGSPHGQSSSATIAAAPGIADEVLEIVKNLRKVGP